jgi:hypothetical protein
LDRGEYRLHSCKHLFVFHDQNKGGKRHLSSDDKAAGFFGCAGMILFLGYGAAQIYAGYIGIHHHLGTGWAVAALVAAIGFRFSLPLTIGSFFGAMNVWGWHWLGAFVFAAPGLAFMALMIPGALASVIGKFKN